MIELKTTIVFKEQCQRHLWWKETSLFSSSITLKSKIWQVGAKVKSRWGFYLQSTPISRTFRRWSQQVALSRLFRFTVMIKTINLYVVIQNGSESYLRDKISLSSQLFNRSGQYHRRTWSWPKRKIYPSSNQSISSE